MVKTIPVKLRAVSITLVGSGLLLVIPLNYYHLQQTFQPSQQNRKIIPVTLPVSPAVVTGPAQRLTIPSLGLALPIIDGNYNPATGQWTLTSNKVQFATPSVAPNNFKGNTLLYGHYRREVFASLHTIQLGATASIDTVNGIRFNYVYTSTEALDPRDTSVFTYQGAPRLTLQTCSGSFYQNRQMFYFRYAGYDKI